MNKGFLGALIVVSALLAPTVSYGQTQLQAKPLFPFLSSEKAAPVTPAPAAAPSTDIVEAAIDLSAIKSQPLPVRRKIIAGELGSIHTRLSLLADKTKATALLLSENDINTASAQTEIAKATLALAETRLTIDALAAAANDPANEGAITLMVGTATFKETVIAVENDLRGARTSIITTLSLLKTAVTTPAVVQ